MSRTGEIPYTWALIESQVRDAIMAQASILEAFGPQTGTGLAAAYLGLPDCEDFLVSGVETFDLARHHLHAIVHAAYLYAYQLDGCEQVPPEYWHDTAFLLDCFPMADAEGEPSPFSERSDPPLRRVLATFFARYGMFEEGDGLDPSIRDLSLLANMTVPAVRTSLSKEGFRLEKVVVNEADEQAFRLPSEDAKIWLSRRRGFIPQRVVGATPVQSGFPSEVMRLMSERSLDADALCARAGVSRDWLSALLRGAIAPVDLPALRALSKALCTPEPAFAAAGVQHLLSLEGG